MAHQIGLTMSLILLTFCIGRGDGRWKKRDRDSLYHNIDVFKAISEKIEHEIEAFYEDYPDDQIRGDDIEKTQQEYIKNELGHKTGTRNLLNRKKMTHKFDFTAHVSNEIPVNRKSENVSYPQPTYVTFQSNNLSFLSRDWPKFEDVLLEMGKKYDWKNDRWIKVRRKIKISPKLIESNTISFHEKHRFSYRTVKLNRKSRRNVVIAVTAVR